MHANINSEHASITSQGPYNNTNICERVCISGWKICGGRDIYISCMPRGALQSNSVVYMVQQ